MMTGFGFPVVMAAAYLAGSIPFGLLFTRLAGKGDIRAIGSGNTGATNVLRTGSKPLALLTLIFDGGKGAAVVLLATVFTADPLLIGLAGLFAVIGHCFPVWLGFQGGKGVATCVATFAAFDPRLGLSSFAVARHGSDHTLLVTVGTRGDARLQHWRRDPRIAGAGDLGRHGDERAQLDAASCQYRTPSERHGKPHWEK